MTIIDFRFRPPVSNFLTGWLYDIEHRVEFAPRFGASISPSTLQKSLALCVAEMTELDIIGVVPGRKSFGNMDNGDLIRLRNQYPERFICLAGLDPSQPLKTTLDEIDRYVTGGGCAGVNIEPGYCQPQIMVNDKSIMYPIYEKCQKENIPVLLAFGGLCYASLRYMLPQMLDQVAEDFPDLKIVLAHGGFPWVHEVCWIALSKKNVYLAPDLYAMHGPGAADYIAAANYLLRDKILFASAYPVVSMQDAVRHYQTCGIHPDRLPDIFYHTAAKVLGLEN